MPALTPWITMDVLVTVKAYPSVSQTYGEAVCVAGVRLDTPKLQWIRLYPVQFRDLPDERQFSKYAVIRLEAQRHSTDRRAETWRPNQDSIRVIDKIPSGGPWLARRRLVEPLIGPTMCELNSGRAHGAPGASLGLVRPKEIVDVEASPAGSWSESQRNLLEQGSLLSGPPKSRLERPGHAFHYRWICMEPRCTGHRQTIADWECGQAYRKWEREGYQPVEAVRQKWLKLVGPDRDAYFFVGDQHQHPASFLVLGVFSPTPVRASDQLSLSL